MRLRLACFHLQEHACSVSCLVTNPWDCQLSCSDFVFQLSPLCLPAPCGTLVLFGACCFICRVETNTLWGENGLLLALWIIRVIWLIWGLLGVLVHVENILAACTLYTALCICTYSRISILVSCNSNETQTSEMYTHKCKHDCGSKVSCT